MLASRASEDVGPTKLRNDGGSVRAVGVGQLIGVVHGKLQYNTLSSASSSDPALAEEPLGVFAICNESPYLPAVIEPVEYMTEGSRHCGVEQSNVYVYDD